MCGVRTEISWDRPAIYAVQIGFVLNLILQITDEALQEINNQTT